MGRASGTHPCHSTVDTAADTGTTLKVPSMPITGTSAPKCCCCVRILCWKLLHEACRGSLGVSEQFQGAWWFWVATGQGLKPHRVPPAVPCSLTCKSSLGSPSAAARVALGSQWWIRDTWSQPGLPGAARRLTPATGEEEKRKKLVFWGTRTTALPVAGDLSQMWHWQWSGHSSSAGLGPWGSHPDPLIPKPSRPSPVPLTSQLGCFLQTSGGPEISANGEETWA